MINIKFPKPNFKIKEENGKELIYDKIRKSWIVLTPEEWVRQNVVEYLVQEKKYPVTLFAIEKEISVGELKKRFDIVVYKETMPWLIIECKQMDIALNNQVATQVLTYNSSVKAKYICITNGSESFLWEFNSNSISELHEFPNW